MVFYIFYVKLEFPDWVLQHMALFLLGSGGLTKEFFSLLFISCWSLGSDPRGGGGGRIGRGEMGYPNTRLSSTSPVLVPTLVIWLSSDSRPES